MSVQNIIRLIELVGFYCFVRMFWWLGGNPRWRVLKTIFGWVCLLIWTVLWSAWVPAAIARPLYPAMRDAFPDGFAADGPFVLIVFLIGWLLPILTVHYRDSKQSTQAE